MDEKIKTKDFQCWKDVGGKGEMVSCNYKRKASEVHIHPDSVILQNVDCDEKSGNLKCSLQNLKPFIPGQKWNSHFDYCGMLEIGKNTKISDGVKQLNKLFDSYEDVNYHNESAPLLEAIKLIKAKKGKLAEEKLKEFNKLNEDSLKESC